MALKHHKDRLAESVSPHTMFPDLPTLGFEPGTDTCPGCAQKLTVIKTRTRPVATLAIGNFKAHESMRGCKRCENPATYGCDELLKIVPHRCNFGFDILVHVGISTFIDCRTETDIRLELQRSHVPISPTQITYLARKFIVCLALAHAESRQRIRNFVNRPGGYILHLDATCDGDSPHLMRKSALECKKVIDSRPFLVDAFQESLKRKKLQGPRCWTNAGSHRLQSRFMGAGGKKQGRGYGFPFDQPHLAFYERLGVIYKILNQINDTKSRKDRQAYKPCVKITQIDKYRDKLFADPLIVDTPHGTVNIQPQRTNVR